MRSTSISLVIRAVVLRGRYRERPVA
eukprot:COSAG06_NODE_43347_length_373_cov_0.379562_1_plen_25_part_10